MLIVAFTSALIASIGVFGVYPVLYSITSSRMMFALNATFAFFLEANIFFNYYTSVFRNAGRVADFFNLRLLPPARNSFDDFTFCEKCDPLCTDSSIHLRRAMQPTALQLPLHSMH